MVLEVFKWFFRWIGLRKVGLERVLGRLELSIVNRIDLDMDLKLKKLEERMDKLSLIF